MNDKYELRTALEDVRACTLRLLVGVGEDDFRRQIHPDFSPLGWHLGHIGVTEAYWILQQCKQESSLSVFYDSFFVPTDNPKPNRVNLPAREEILDYLHTARERVLAFLSQADFRSDHPLLRAGNIFNMLLQHEEQHNETMLLILHLLAADSYEQGKRQEAETLSRSDRLPVPLLLHRKEESCHQRREMTHVPGGLFIMGSDDISCTLDNERPQYAIAVAEFLIDQYPVSNRDFMHFIDNGGYQTPQWWAPVGWQWREQNNIEHPLYWRQGQQGNWCEISLAGVQPLVLDEPVKCISWYEADAYARSLGKRLPTESEWEKAARAGYLEESGQVWEWTSSWFLPYPEFVAHPYDGYSVPYFDHQHRVLRGGSWVTGRHVRRPTFRNWYHPWRREVFGGVRCVKNT